MYFQLLLIKERECCQSVLLIFLTQWDQSTFAIERLREEALRPSHLIIVQGAWSPAPQGCFGDSDHVPVRILMKARIMLGL